MLRDKDFLVGRLVGGLGNQLFIWAATNYYATKLKKITGFEIYESDKYKLEQILARNIETIEISIFKRFLIEMIIKVSRRNLFARISANLLFGIYTQESTGFAGEREPDKNSTYLVGYFQSARYVQDLSRSAIQNEFNLSLHTDNALQAKDRFQNDGGIGIHIRLGDYLNEENQYFGILAPSYFMNSLESLQVGAGSTVWVFTDSPDMAKSIYSRALESKYTLLWASSAFGLSTIEEFKLLTNARKLVIANSTFSWWAALLAGERSQIICPSKWFEFAADPEAIMPNHWTAVESIWLQRKMLQ